MERNILKSSLENASFRIIFQILLRCVTFILNAWILRLVGAEILGVMNVRLLLLESTLLFLSQEPCLKACQTNVKELKMSQILNQIWLSLPACFLLTIPLLHIWLNILSLPGEDLNYQYRLGCYSMAFSCVIDQISNAPLIIATLFCFVKTKIVFDTLHMVVRTVIFVILAVRDKNQAITAFAVAQIASTVFLCLMLYVFFWWYIRRINQIREQNKDDIVLKKESKTIFSGMQDFQFKSITDFLPTFRTKDGFLNKNLSLLTVSFAKQSILKQVLTEGERYVMTLSPVLTFSEQATYDVVNNLGSVAARFLFRPIEESSYFYFTQMIRRGESLKNQDMKNISEASQVLSQLCAIVTSIGITGLIFGQSYSNTLLSLYGGDTLVSSTLPTTLLQFHCCAIVLLAINGVTEAYVFATMNNKELDRYNGLMVIFSISFLVLSYIFTFVMGPVGFILANCINMIARIIHSLYYIMGQYKDSPFHPLKGIIPKKRFLSVLLMMGLFCKLSEIYIYRSSMLVHIIIGACCFIISIAVWAYDYQSLLRMGIERYRRNSVIKQE